MPHTIGDTDGSSPCRTIYNNMSKAELSDNPDKLRSESIIIDSPCIRTKPPPYGADVWDYANPLRSRGMARIRTTFQMHNSAALQTKLRSHVKRGHICSLSRAKSIGKN